MTPNAPHHPPNAATSSNMGVTNVLAVPSTNISNPVRSNQQIRNRGSQPQRGRGTSRGGGRGGRGNALNYSFDDIWREKFGKAGVFQFGNTPPEPSTQDHSMPAVDGSESDHRVTPGEGGCQTFHLAKVAP